MKPAFTDVVANERLRTRLGTDLQSGTLSHAYILEGMPGSGKHTIALRIAAALACDHRTDSTTPLPCLECPACRKILSKNSPDVIYINRGDKSTLGVEVIRDLRRDVYVAPNDISAKIYVIEDAHLMTHQAQNAFLLTLEEPPPYVLFLLLCENASLLLETVRSRAPVLRTEAVSPEQITQYLCTHNADAERLNRTDPSQLGEIVAAADGSIGRAATLLNPKLYKPLSDRRQAAREFIRLCSTSRNSVAVLRFLNSLSSKRDELIEQCNVILLCLRDLLLCKQTEHAPLCFFPDREEACALAYSFTTPKLLSFCNALNTAIDRLRVNANVKLTLTTMAQECNLL
ncbi:MAG: hypothetical protein IJW50_06070 [Clostridia bacterium]|nr:hypothetical protein [Clostridia bacterium]